MWECSVPRCVHAVAVRFRAPLCGLWSGRYSTVGCRSSGVESVVSHTAALLDRVVTSARKRVT
eukprot:2426873-Rhodomonas_salina.1